MKKRVLFSALLLLSANAFADFVSLTIHDQTVLYSSADGYVFSLVEAAGEDLEVTIELAGDRASLVDVKDFYQSSAIGNYELYKVDDDGLIDDGSHYGIDDNTAFEVLSYDALSGAMSFSFNVADKYHEGQFISGSGCIGGSCGIAPVPLPAAAWFFASALLGLFGVRLKR